MGRRNDRGGQGSVPKGSGAGSPRRSLSFLVRTSLFRTLPLRYPACYESATNPSA